MQFFWCSLAGSELFTSHIFVIMNRMILFVFFPVVQFLGCIFILSRMLLQFFLNLEAWRLDGLRHWSYSPILATILANSSSCNGFCSGFPSRCSSSAFTCSSCSVSSSVSPSSFYSTSFSFSSPSNCGGCSSPESSISTSWLVPPWGFSNLPLIHANLTDFLCFDGLAGVLAMCLRFGAGRVSAPSIVAISSSQLLCCWAKLWLTISRISPWWLTTDSTCCDFFMLQATSCNNEFKNAGRFTEHFSFNTTQSLRCHDFTTSFLPSQVM